jgi:hypothetical protein
VHCETASLGERILSLQREGVLGQIWEQIECSALVQVEGPSGPWRSRHFLLLLLLVFKCMHVHV